MGCHTNFESVPTKLHLSPMWFSRFLERKFWCYFVFKSKLVQFASVICMSAVIFNVKKNNFRNDCHLGWRTMLLNIIFKLFIIMQLQFKYKLISLVEDFNMNFYQDKHFLHNRYVNQLKEKCPKKNPEDMLNYWFIYLFIYLFDNIVNALHIKNINYKLKWPFILLFIWHLQHISI